MRYYLAALASAALATSAEADTVKVNFAGQFDSGSFAGQYYEGDFTYDTYFKFVDNYDKYTYY